MRTLKPTVAPPPPPKYTKVIVPPPPRKTTGAPPPPPRKTTGAPPPPPKDTKVIVPPPPPRNVSSGQLITRDEWTNDKLYSYQNDAVDFVTSNKHAMLMMFLSGGKTIVMLTAFNRLRQQGKVKRMLVVSTLRICQLVWQQEAKKWEHTRHLKLCNLTDSVAKKRQQALFKNIGDADIFLINFESLGWLTEQIMTYFIGQGEAMPFDMLNVDEITKMKNVDANRFKDFSRMLPYFKRRTGMTGTPSPNGASDLYGQYFIIDRGKRLSPSARHFTATDKDGNQDTYSVAKVGFKLFKEAFFDCITGYMGYQKLSDRDDTHTMIASAVADITFTCEGASDADLPSINLIDVMIELPSKIMKKYDKLESDMLLYFDDDTEVLDVENTASLRSKLRQLANGIVYKYVDPEIKETRTEHLVHREKFKALDELVEGNDRDSMIISYQFTSERDKIMKMYKSKGIECLTGANESDAVRMIKEFNSGDLRLLLLHEMSGGHGLNLQHHCNTIVQFGLSDNLETNDQIIARLVRQNSYRDHVNVIRILAKSTIETAMASAMKFKAKAQEDMKEKLTVESNKLLSRAVREYADKKHINDTRNLLAKQFT